MRRWLRHHPKVESLNFKAGVKRPEKSNAIDAFVDGAIGRVRSIIKVKGDVTSVPASYLGLGDRLFGKDFIAC